MNIKSFLQNKAIFLILFTVVLTACALIPPAKPDLTTGNLPTTSQVSNENIITAVKVNLKQYKFLLVQAAEPGLLNRYIAGSLKNMALFSDVITPKDFGEYLVSHGYTNNRYDYFELTNLELNTIIKKNGINFLILEVKFAPHDTLGIKIDMHMKVYDPTNEKTYFAIKYTSPFAVSNSHINASLNAFANWVRHNK